MDKFVYLLQNSFQKFVLLLFPCFLFLLSEPGFGESLSQQKAKIPPKKEKKKPIKPLTLDELIDKRDGKVEMGEGKDELKVEFPELEDVELGFLKGNKKIVSLTIFNGSKITDKGAVYIQTYTNLSSLSINHSKITNKGLVNLKSLVKLQDLVLTDSKITDEGLPILLSVKNLKRLDLSTTKLKSPSLRTLQKLPELEELNLGDTHIDDKSLEHIKLFPKLKIFSLRNTEVSINAIQKLEKELTNIKFHY